ncbi:MULTISPECIES: C40 family peptidase [Pasteurellaceae]|uniref:NlpC/P60 family protein n=1 Tax=Pasteurella atlantica TaxID=2827233 RepID=A0AAW8CP65_9PAST|nr:NlpC/P60 family protein [Pasteurella atlantica]MBR0573221.1 C40 family peptidase [Pasteurella atlantica]MDP8039163.1 NlpC/P60 family protein [Pasteurella atlantica]MDP8041238.1 NlpC/P60 family protein [Pasteurella atlantica]MDP8043375.1 NlpC/P60 family protein [Pasteurella atlantica]MDP8045461.1 NlpC/P60 family protein [Pasteurella atlantica]
MLSLCLVSCSADPSFSNEIYIVNKLVKQHRIWKGTPYRLGGNTPQGVDCSGLTTAIFKNSFGIHLPRTTKLQAKTGAYVPKKYLQAGDLVFFKTGRGPFGNHVGIYVKNGHFLHASSKKGVIYSNLNSPYYKRVYWQARRLQ